MRQEGAISILSDQPLKFVDKFKYLGSNTSSSERDEKNMHKESVDSYWQVVDHTEMLSFCYNNKKFFFLAGAVSVLLYGCTTCT